MVVLHKIESLLFKLLSVLTVICFIALCIVVFIQVFSRVALPSSPVWTEELSRYLFIYMITFASGLAYVSNEFIGVEFLSNKLNGKWLSIYHVVINLLVAIFSGLLISYAYDFMTIGGMQTSPTLSMPMNYIYLATVIIFVNFFIFSLMKIFFSISLLLSKSKVN